MIRGSSFVGAPADDRDATARRSGRSRRDLIAVARDLAR
jgi:hypothetical protein